MFDLHVRDLADEIVFKIWDKHMFYSTPIGLFNIKVSALCINRGNMHDENINLDFPILYDNKKVGSLKFLSQYTPTRMQETTYDTESKQTEVKEIQTRNQV